MKHHATKGDNGHLNSLTMESETHRFIVDAISGNHSDLKRLSQVLCGGGKNLTDA